MINSARREEYVALRGNEPFVLQVGIERSANQISSEQNWHDEIEIELCTEGEGEVLLDGKRYCFERGDLVLINSNVLHHTGSSSKVVYSCLIPQADLCRAVGFDPTQVMLEPIVRDPEINKLIDSLTESKNVSSLERCKILLEILLRIQKNHSRPIASNEVTDTKFNNVRSAIAMIHSGYYEHLTLDSISKGIYVDKYALCREFKKATGQTVTEYINSYRVQMAANLISQGSRVTEAARACGFENMSFFTKTFKKYMGCLPSSFKRQ